MFMNRDRITYAGWIRLQKRSSGYSGNVVGLVVGSRIRRSEDEEGEIFLDRQHPSVSMTTITQTHLSHALGTVSWNRTLPASLSLFLLFFEQILLVELLAALESLAFEALCDVDGTASVASRIIWSVGCSFLIFIFFILVGVKR